uniref:Dephospho-CoA kinase domain-containing protein n=1 Tax=Hirondellea gigas TaxID=1518452 RepID=A0A2P2HWQ5_9CRUS
MFLIGLTGGIASGKSSVCQILQELGVPVVDADLIAREVVEIGSPAYLRIEEEFGPEVFQQSGELDRGKLGALIFADAEKRKRINSITHPQIYAKMRSQVFRHFLNGEQMVVLDLPLLYETGRALTYIYKTIVVSCDKDEQKRRLQLRGGYTELQAQDRIESQMPLDLKTARADYVIENTGQRQYTRQQVEDIVRTLRRSKHHILNKLLLGAGAVMLLAILIVFSYTVLGLIARKTFA